MPSAVEPLSIWPRLTYNGAQVVEVTRHLAGRTGTLVHRPDAGLTHCTGGGISGYDHAVCTIHVLTATLPATHGQAVTFRAIADGTLPR